LYYRMLYGENGVVEWAKKWQADAIIAQLSDVNIELLNDLNIPIINMSYDAIDLFWILFVKAKNPFS